jgi:nitroreductase
MQSINEAIQFRRAIKYFDSSQGLTDEELNEILFDALKLPHASKISPWKIVNIKDKELRESIRKVGFDQPQHTEASALLAIFFDHNAWAESIKRWKNLHSSNQCQLNITYQDDEKSRDEAMQSCGLLAQSIMIEAARRRIDSCPMIGFNFEEVGKLLNKPDSIQLCLFVALGKRAFAPLKRGSKIAVDEVIYQENLG